MKNIKSVIIPCLLFLNGFSQQKVDSILKERLLDTVTVISSGYQTLPKERATGSFEVVKEKQINQQFSTDILSRLESVSTVLFDKSNLPLRPKNTVRGVSSINGPKDPLIILDNFPYEGDIKTINPNLIESATVLRDAAAASIWGARAGNGVIVITTKKGKYEQPLQLDLVVNTSVLTKPDLFSLPIINSSEVVKFEKWLFDKGYRFSDTSDVFRSKFSPVYEILYKQRNGIISQQEAESQLNKFKDTDVRNDYKRYIYGLAVNKQYFLTASGGSKSQTYRFAAGYDHNVDNLKSLYKRLSLKSESRFRITTNLTIAAALSFTTTTTQSGRTGYSPLNDFQYNGLVDDNGNEIPRYMYRQPYIDTAGQGRLMDWKYYPLSDHKHNIRDNKSDHLLINFLLQQQLSKSFQLTGNYQWENQKSIIENTQDIQSYNARDLINRFSQVNQSSGVVTYIIPRGGIVDRNYSYLGSHNFRTQLNFNKEKSNYSINAIAGGELRERKDLTNAYRIYGFDANSMSLSPVDYVNTYPNFITKFPDRIPNNLSETRKAIRYISLFSNVAFLYRMKYGFSASVRRDASNLFGVETNQKWRPQWSTGVSWTISNEKFITATVIDFLKLRASYGSSGNVDQSRSGVTTVQYSSSVSVAGFSQALISRFPNPSLRWEKVSIMNIGLDFSLVNRRISGSLDYYNKTGSDLFGAAPIDYTTGVATLNLTRNIASTKGGALIYH